MKKITLAILVLLIYSLTLVSGAAAFSCGTRLVYVGETKWQVVSKCGPPDWRDAWMERRLDRVFGAPYTNWDYYGTRIPRAVVVDVLIEEWVYNLGPTKFVRILRFENNRLVEIYTTSDYGY